MNTAPIRKSMPRKPPAKRLFSGVAGSPLSTITAEPAPATPSVTTTAAPALTRAQKSALRSKRRREERKKNSAFVEKERRRKQAERGEPERERKLREVLESGEFPLSLSKLRNQSGPQLTATNEYGRKTVVTTGGYGQHKLEEIEIKQINAAGGPDAQAQPKRPPGHSPDSKLTSTALRVFGYIPPKEVKKMRALIDSHTDTKPMMVCLSCQQQIAPEHSYDAAFVHFETAHPALFEDMMARVKKARACPEDHAAFVAKHKADFKLYCGKCRRLIYDPAKVRSDTKTDGAKPASELVSTLNQ
jgi:hypothetical protein